MRRYITSYSRDPSTDDGHWLVGTGLYIEEDELHCCHQCLPERYPSILKGESP